MRVHSSSQKLLWETVSRRRLQEPHVVVLLSISEDRDAYDMFVGCVLLWCLMLLPSMRLMMVGFASSRQIFLIF